MSARSKKVLIFTVLIIKFWFLSKLAPIFGFFMKFTKKINHHLFILNCFFGFILSYIKNCIPLNIMYPKGQPLSSIKKYFYWYWKLYQQLQITLYIEVPYFVRCNLKNSLKSTIWNLLQLVVVIVKLRICWYVATIKVNKQLERI